MTWLAILGVWICRNRMDMFDEISVHSSSIGGAGFVTVLPEPDSCCSTASCNGVSVDIISLVV
ncbi:hypothetical protein [Sphingobacterium paucimobilis]|uniref:hypothetical protein n=1 Tax=Sphingobacterium paucimobilis TaxID=1385985 RepID=UPI0011833485|nr:hypothetical protein [Sphingobacterium paucimobilis]